MDEEVNITELLQLEEELLKSTTAPSPELDAKVNLLKYIQISTVTQYEAAYDGLFYELNKDGGLECLRRNIVPVRSKDSFLQPKVCDVQGYDGAAKLDKLADFYLADAQVAKRRLDEFIQDVIENLEGCGSVRVQYAKLKSRESTVRKAEKSYGGNVQRVADMARVAVVCETPELLEQVFKGIVGRLQPENVKRVSNGFNSDWMPSGYRDVKVNSIVNEHLCEIQLQLDAFYSLKAGQHAVYEWARELNVTAKIEAEHLFKNLSGDIGKEMVHLAEQNWLGTKHLLPEINMAFGCYPQAEEGLNKVLSEAEDKVLCLEENTEEWRRALITEVTATTNLGSLFIKQGKYADAELYCTRSLGAREKILGREHPDVALSLSNLGVLFNAQSKHAEAEPLHKRSLAIREGALGREHPSVAVSLNNLAFMLSSQGKYTDAEQLYTRSLNIRQKVLGPENRDVASSFGNLAGLLTAQGKYADAELLLKRSLAMREKVLGPEHHEVASSLNTRAAMLIGQGKYAEAEPLVKRVLAVGEKALGLEHPDVAVSLNTLAALSNSQGKYAEAERLYTRSLDATEKALGPEHPTVAISLNNLATLLAKQGKCVEAEPLHKRSLAIREKALGPEHSEVAISLNNLAALLNRQGKYADAEPVFRRSLAIRKKVLGPYHSDVAVSLNNLAAMFNNQGRYEEAEPLFKRAIAIFEASLGSDHLYLASPLNNLASVLGKQGKHNQAFMLMERAVTIRARTLGEGHGHTITTREKMELIRKQV